MAMLALLAIAVEAAAQELPNAQSPRTGYQIGVASQAASLCRDVQLADDALVAEVNREAMSNSLVLRAMTMGNADFKKEFLSAYNKGREQLVCSKYLRRFPTLLTRR
ncbi:hypothetical protein QO058_18910 [Bosea vestrisii]|uniref:hypothetical protein n=1 Tax=Bosea vestrisii TaxID=151416 RepID=UPI0024E018B8|nr:hypothetical protein [Bosea vestrisii]WID94879.1 hypothetical protein QO058_18910 [Bosea vestrisii]